jgi:cellobiose phosphorylase
MNPGYIKGYVPGVRENGGQYTHAAIWLIMGFARLGHHDKVWELLQLINPVNHGDNRQEADIYKVEPYVLAADVYAIPMQKGRGGWTWYTGSAGWLYQLLTDYLVGLHKESDKLYLRPCLPVEWPEVKVNYRFFETVYSIVIRRTADPKGLLVDGKENTYVPLINDQQPHNVVLEIPMEENGTKALPAP